MIKSNLRMSLLLFEEIISKQQLDTRLLKILNQGFIQKDGCYFLKSFYEADTNVTQRNFIDKTGYEAFINSFHVDDYVEDNYFLQTILFVKMLSIYWGELTNQKNIETIIAETSFGFNVRFHVVREGEIYNDENLENYKEGVIIIPHELFYDNQVSLRLRT